MILPGATIGVLGAGQLGRMTATAAAELGYKVSIFGQAPSEPAMQFATTTTIAPWSDHRALQHFARACDVVTLEFENVPIAALEQVARYAPVRPGATVLDIAQHRGREKDACNNAGVGTAPFILADDVDTLATAVKSFDYDVVVKTCRFGYDGKGQVRVRPGDVFDANTVMATLLGDHDALGKNAAAQDIGPRVIVEKCIPFSCEISVIGARSASGEVAVFPCAMNTHVDGILRESQVPAGISPEVEAAAQAIAKKLLTAFDVEGLLAVELFVVGDPLDPAANLLVNEVAPRPHNSGHWTQDGCATSQFTQLVRAVCGLGLGATTTLAPTRMENLIGDDVDGLARLLSDRDCAVHMYGKDSVRPGRKMGHVNWRQPPKSFREQ